MLFNSSRFAATSKKPPELFDALAQVVVTRAQILERGCLDHSTSKSCQWSVVSGQLFGQRPMLESYQGRAAR
jgi:hypothetical protein